MTNKLEVYGQEKEVKFIAVNKNNKTVSVCFTDKTAIFLSDVKVVIDNE